LGSLDTIAQVGIGVFGASAVFLVGSKDRRVARWGFLCGLAGQPFWVYTTWHHQQLGILALTAYYTNSWARGAVNNWRKTDAP
jgi:hypothetical protein